MKDKKTVLFKIKLKPFFTIIYFILNILHKMIISRFKSHLKSYTTHEGIHGTYYVPIHVYL